MRRTVRIVTATTDAGGVAAAQPDWKLANGKDHGHEVDREGNRAVVPVELEAARRRMQLCCTPKLRRCTARATAFGCRSARPVAASAYVDVVKTVRPSPLTISISSTVPRTWTCGHTGYAAGTVDLNAYVFGRDGRPTGDHRNDFVQPADELRIETHGGFSGVDKNPAVRRGSVSR